MPQPLNSKEASLFKQVIRNYETKQYKKGLKAAEQILRKAPNHGDTLAMKALIINSQGRPDEAFALAKVALKNDMKSHVCWHVYGLLYRAEKNFEEAIKAYKFALRLEPDSQQIQRDLALLQIQMRDYQGYEESRNAMLQARSGLRQNWTALAIAHHLAGNLSDAEKVLTTYEETLKTPPPKTDIEHSEAVLYKNTIIAEMGETERALDHLNAVSKQNPDKTAVSEMIADYLLKLGRKEEAAKAYRHLLDRNAEYKTYYQGLEKSLGLERTDTKGLEALYAEYAQKNPRGDAALRIPLEFLEGDDFRRAADRYLHKMFSKGVPSTFANLKALYSDEFKRNTLEESAHNYASGQTSPPVNGTAEKQTNGDSSPLQSSAYYFLAQHYNYHMTRNLEKALHFIEKAIDLGPKSVDYHMTKARIMKHYGNTQSASELMEHARTLDERDRYINTKSAKYQLRNNENGNALYTMSKFTRNEVAGGPLADLHDMQCMWYITEDGEAYMRQGKFGLALKRFTSVFDIFDIWQEDQFDFHSFSLRKGQIRAYVDMIRWEDRLREHPFYSRVAVSAIKIYVLLHDKPQLARESSANGINGGSGDLTNMDPSERRKALKKARKDQQKQEKAEAEKKDTKKPNTPATTADGEPKKEDTDPQGTSLLQTTEPLKGAMKFLTPLLDFSPKNIDAQNIGFEVFMRRKKFLLALKCLLAASKIDADDPNVHENTVRFRLEIDEASSSLPPKVIETINSSHPNLPTKADLTQFNKAFLSNHPDSALHIYSYLRVRRLQLPLSQPRNEEEVLATLDLEEITLDEAKEGLNLLKDWRSGNAEGYMKRAATKWPEATHFKSK
ncbi:MAG: hypothetical protein M1836_005560 [Candelina mexicana]|nr:MAG: hypothetical protein M1836_005560 [Candelina mexicana]